eukprot:COSAG01_NODE_7640_length_3117_cov_99.838308_1_plen_448_part_00
MGGCDGRGGGGAAAGRAAAEAEATSKVERGISSIHMPRSKPKFRRTIKSAGANATTGGGTVSLLSGAVQRGCDSGRIGSFDHGGPASSMVGAGWGGWSSKLPNEAAAMVVTDPSALKCPMEHRNKVLAKLVQVLEREENEVRSKAECIRVGREIEQHIHAECIGKRDYKLAAVERILRIEQGGSLQDPLVSDGTAASREDQAQRRARAKPATASRPAGGRRSKLPLPAGAAAAAATMKKLPSALRKLDGEKRRSGGDGSSGDGDGRRGGLVRAALPLARQYGLGSSAVDVDEEDLRRRAVENLSKALAWGYGEGHRDHAPGEASNPMAGGPADGDGDRSSGGGHKRRRQVDQHDDTTATATATAVEDALWRVLGRSREAGGLAAYRRQLRALVFNLRSEGGEELRDSLLSGRMAAADAPRLRPEDLASSALRAAQKAMVRDRENICD